MPTSTDKVKQFYSAIKNINPLIESIKHKQAGLIPDERIPIGGQGAEATINRLNYLSEKGISLPFLTGKQGYGDTENLHGNIENFVGFTQMPVGVAGPVHILGSEAVGDYYIPLATTEGALVASYDRGARASRIAGGITSVCLAEGVQRSPVFKFKNVAYMGEFISWVLQPLNIPQGMLQVKIWSRFVPIKYVNI